MYMPIQSQQISSSNIMSFNPKDDFADFPPFKHGKHILLGYFNCSSLEPISPNNFNSLFLGPPVSLKSQVNIPRPSQRILTNMQTKDELYYEFPNPQHDDFICELPNGDGPFQTFDYVYGMEEFQRPNNQLPISVSPRKLVQNKLLILPAI